MVLPDFKGIRYYRRSIELIQDDELRGALRLDVGQWGTKMRRNTMLHPTRIRSTCRGPMQDKGQQAD
jgi:hypothetical protein